MTAWLEVCTLASTPTDNGTGNIPINPSTYTGTIDGTTLTNGIRVLLKHQSTASQNGTYTYNSTTHILTATSDVFENSSTLRVDQGVTQAHTVWSVNDLTNYIWTRQITKANVRDFNARGDGSTDDSTAITNAMNAIPASGGTLLFPAGKAGSSTANYFITSSVTIPSNVHVHFEEGAILAPSGATATLNGRVSAHPTQQIFGGTGVNGAITKSPAAAPTITVSGNPTGSFNVLISIGSVASVTVNTGGSGYTSPPSVTFGAPPSGGTASGAAIVNAGAVVAVTVTSPGWGYTFGAPSVTFSPSGPTTTVNLAPPGTLGTMVFQYSLDAGTTWSTAIPTVAGSSFNYAIPGTGLTVTFPGGATSYAAGTTYSWTCSPPVALTRNAFDVFSVRNFGAQGDGVTDDTAAIGQAIGAFVAAARATSPAAPELYFPAGTYLVSDTLLVANITGAVIAGAGQAQTVIQGGSTGGPRTKGICGAAAILRLTNCQRVTTRDLSILGASTSATLNAAAAGSTSVTVTPVAAAGTFAAGQLAIVSVPSSVGASFAYFEVVTVVNANPSTGTISLAAPLINSYAAGSSLTLCPVACWESYSDGFAQAQVPSANRVERVTVGSTSLYATLDGFATNCAGGTGSPTDANNDNHVVSHCLVNNAARAAAHIGHLNSLAVTFLDCSLGGTLGIQVPSGGSFVVRGGSITALLWDFDLAGAILHQPTVVATYTESGSGFVHAAAGASTTLASPAAANQTSLTVTSPSGFAVGQMVVLGTGTPTESKTIAAISGATITLAASLVYAYPAGATVSTGLTNLTLSVSGFDKKGSNGTVLTGSSGSNTLPVATTTCFTPGQTITITRQTGNAWETAVIASLSTSGTITTVNPLIGSYGVNDFVSGYVLDVTGTGTVVKVAHSNLSPGNDTGAQLHMVDARATLTQPGSFLVLTDCDLGASGYVLDSVQLIDHASRWTSSTAVVPMEQVLNSGQVMSMNAAVTGWANTGQYSVGQLRGVKSIASPGSKGGSNLAGNVTVGGTSPSATLTFGTAEPDGDYMLTITPRTVSVGAAANSWRVQSYAPSASGFTVTTEAAPGSGQFVVFSWHLIRAGFENLGSWTPLDIPGLVLWLQPSGLPASGAVAQWTDGSGHAHNLSQSLPAAQPALGTAPNGFPCIQLNGTSQCLQATLSSALTDASNWSAFTVQAFASASVTSHIVTVGTDFANGYGLSNDSGSRAIYMMGNAYCVDGAIPVGTPPTWEIWSATGAPVGSNLSLYVNSMSQSITPSANNIQPTSGQVMVGASIDLMSVLHGFMQGSIAEIIVVNQVVSNTTRQRAELYLSDKYGIPL
jgi:polygalacturonase